MCPSGSLFRYLRQPYPPDSATAFDITRVALIATSISEEDGERLLGLPLLEQRGIRKSGRYGDQPTLRACGGFGHQTTKRIEIYFNYGLRKGFKYPN